MNDTLLRRKVAKLAYDKPELRPHLLPLLKSSSLLKNPLVDAVVRLLKRKMSIKRLDSTHDTVTILGDIEATPMLQSLGDSKMPFYISIALDYSGWSLTIKPGRYDSGGRVHYAKNTVAEKSLSLDFSPKEVGDILEDEFERYNEWTYWAIKGGRVFDF